MRVWWVEMVVEGREGSGVAVAYQGGGPDNAGVVSGVHCGELV